jgi:hypothetical protein
MSPTDLWGDFEVPENVQTPFGILQEQASIFSKKTNYVLLARAKREDGSFGRLAASLHIVSGALNNYDLEVLGIEHGIEMYPVKIIDQLNNQRYEGKDEKQFLELLARVLQSEKLKRVVSSLMVQSK